MEFIYKLIIGILIFVVLYHLLKPRRDSQRCLSDSDRKELLKKQNYICATCDDKDWRLFEAHHKKKWAENGRTNIENCILVCPKCHRKLNRDYDK